jgi:hypothetical protein
MLSLNRMVFKNAFYSASAIFCMVLALFLKNIMYGKNTNNVFWATQNC